MACLRASRPIASIVHVIHWTPRRLLSWRSVLGPATEVRNDAALVIGALGSDVVVAVDAPAEEQGTAPLTGTELYNACLQYAQVPEGDRGRTCGMYIRGFIDGSNRIVVMPRKEAQQQPESFAERAWRTNRPKHSSAKPDFCIAGDVSLRVLVEQLLMQASVTLPTEATRAADLLYATLSRFHKC